MEFILKKNSTFPPVMLKMEDTYEIDKKEMLKLFKNATCTFSMVDPETNKYIIANKGGGILIEENKESISEDSSDVFIFYKWSEKDTKNSGSFIGEFTINFFDDENKELGKSIFPIKDDLNIIIQESYGKTSVNGW